MPGISPVYLSHLHAWMELWASERRTTDTQTIRFEMQKGKSHTCVYTHTHTHTHTHTPTHTHTHTHTTHTHHTHTHTHTHTHSTHTHTHGTHYTHGTHCTLRQRTKAADDRGRLGAGGRYAWHISSIPFSSSCMDGVVGIWETYYRYPNRKI